MKLFLNALNAQLMQTLNGGALGPLTLTAGDTFPLELVFVEGSIPVTGSLMEGGRTLKVGIKMQPGDSSLMALATSYTINGSVLTTTLSLNTAEIATFMNDVVPPSQSSQKMWFEIAIEGSSPTFRRTLHLSQITLNRALNQPEDTPPLGNVNLYQLKSELFDSQGEPINSKYMHAPTVLTNLTGGISGCLDAISTSALALPQCRFIWRSALGLFNIAMLEVDAVTPAQAEKVVRPTDFNAVTNPKQWKIVI